MKPTKKLMYQRIAVWALGAAIVSGVAPAAAPHLNNNFHVLVDGVAYRSAQPSGDEIRLYYADHKIASILNLRGGSPGAPWYDDEVNTAKALGITHIDFPMSARRELTPEQTMALIDIMKKAPKPLLIHCRSGADRTGLASSLFMADIEHKNEDESESQLSLRYGHYAIPVIGTWAMNQTWEAIEPLLGFKNS